MIWLDAFFPDDWYTDVIVLRGGGRDARGNPRPEEQIPVTRCLIIPSSTSEGEGFDDITDSKITLRRTEKPAFTFLSTDRVRIPEGSRMAGDWSVAGRPGEWPVGVEVPLERA